MGDPSAVKVILNRKYLDPEKQARLAEEQAGRSREELGLARSLRPAQAEQAAEPRLFGREEDG